MGSGVAGILLFLIGLGATYRVRVIGLIGLSEILIFGIAPVLFLVNWGRLKKDGFMPVLTLCGLTMLGCGIASWQNNIYVVDFIRGCASPYAIFASIVVIHALLSKSPKSICWLALGLGVSFAVSSALRGGSGAASGVSLESEEYRAQVLLLYAVIPLILCPIAGWYMKLPLLYSIGAPFALSAYCLLSSSSGRSMAFTCACVGLLTALGFKNEAKMSNIRRHFFKFAIVALVFVAGFKYFYEYAAAHGMLGDAQRTKYERQTHGKKGVASLIMGGRVEFFVGLRAALDKPIIGHGPWAQDIKGYYVEFLEKYGDSDDLQRYIQARYQMGYVNIIPTHSHIVGFWVSYGIFGLIFWCYVLWLFYDIFKHHIGAVPEFYGYICVWLPPFVWAIFFSPFSERVQLSALVTVLLMVRNANKARARLCSRVY